MEATTLVTFAKSLSSNCLRLYLFHIPLQKMILNSDSIYKEKEESKLT